MMPFTQQLPDIASTYKGQSYRSYMQATRAHIQATRRDLHDANAEHIIEANCPAEYRPAANSKHAHQGILLVHGLLESPYNLYSIFQHYRQQGYWVRSLLLPGHGTVAEALLDCQWQNWLATVYFGITSFQGLVEDINIIGFSTGASLALYLSLCGAAIDRIVAFAPAIYLRNPLAHCAQYLAHLYPWFMRHREIDYAKYQSLPFHAIAQVAHLSRRLAQASQHTAITTPMLMILSDADEVISSDKTRRFF